MARYAIIDSDYVINIVEAAPEFAALQGWIDATEANVGDLYKNGAFISSALLTKSLEEIRLEVVTTTQQRLDNFARTRNYDGILSLCTYATSSIPKFAAEGQRGVDNRDQTWASLYTIMGEVQQGQRPMPSGFGDIEADLPPLEWPTL